MKNKKRLMNVRELGEILKLKIPSIYGLCNHKKIPYVKMGHSLRFDIDDIWKWIKECKVQPKGKGK